MEKERTSKIIAVVALVIGVVALSIGFAAYSRDMNITDLDGEINPGEMELDVLFDNDTTADNDLANVFGQGVAAVEGEDGAELIILN